jgi:heterodisulfide reductase subunit B/NAD-dependent dihydropyrimidine dehydrogenase PreA subunit
LNDFIFFWGCTIPGRLPFLEKSLRLVLEKLGIKFREIDGFTCCPEKFIVETMSEEAWYLTAARNLALAEKNGGDLLVACNGCYASFRSAISAFSSSADLRRIVSERLSEIGLEYSFRSTVHHVVEVLHDSVGPEVIERRISKSMDGMKVGVHTGCQMLRPSPTVRIDDPLRPVKLDRLVEALGATSLDYNSKLLCCGEALGRSGNPAESTASARMKLVELAQLGADAVVVVCPACFQQFETQQMVMQKSDESFSLPVFYYSEIAGLALGFSPEELGFEMHRVPTDAFLQRWEELRRMREAIPDVFDYDAMKRCVACASCANDCPVNQVDETFNPHAAMVRILEGEADLAIQGEDIWKCLECGTCTELCPNSFGMIKVFKEAKRLALERGIAPAETRQGIEMFQSTGTLGKTRERARARLGLGPAPETGGEELARLLEGTMRVKDD